MDKYYDNYLALFDSDGWKQFIEEMQDIYESYDYDACATFENFCRVQSARKQLERVLKFENYIRLLMENEETSDVSV